MRKIYKYLPLLFVWVMMTCTLSVKAQITGTTPNSTYIEHAAPITIHPGFTLGGTSAGYGGGYLLFDLANGSVGDVLGIKSDANPNAVGAISVSGTGIFLGNGTGTSIIGSIDGVMNGQNGQKLKINFTSNFPNPSFEQGITGWTVVNQQIFLGTTQLFGFTTPSDPTNPSNTSAGDTHVPQNVTFSNEFSTTEKTNGAQSLRLFSNMTTQAGCDVVHGPYAYSGVFSANAGDVLSFDWRALGGSDAYDVFCYIVNTATGVATVALNQTGANASAATPWTTANVTVPANGNYRFVFISGTWDQTCGQAAGASLYIDNVKVVGNNIDINTISSLAQHITYQNNCGTSSATRNLTVSAVKADNTTVSASSTITLSTFAPVPHILSNLAVNLGTNGQVTVAPNLLDNGSTDDCSIVFTLSKSTFTCADLGANNVVVTLKDPYGNTSTANAVITVSDITPPVLTGVPANTTAQCSSIPAMPTVTVTENCSLNGGLSAYQLPGAAVRSSLVHNYTFSSGATDSKGTANGSNINGVGFLPGIIGTAASFNGSNNYFDMGTAASLNGTGDFAISVWVKTASSAGQTIIQQRAAAIQGQYILNLGANHAGSISYPGRVYFMIYNSDFQFEIVSAIRVDDNQWHHIVAERKGTDGNIYVDGVLQGSGSGPVQALNATIPTYIGRDMRDNSKNFNGLIDELKIYGPSSCPSNYDIERTWSAKDIAGNQTIGQQIITVQDTQAPVLSAAPANTTVECDAVPAAATLTATDNCDGAPVVTFSEVRTNGACANTYTLTRTWTAKDACGNTATQTQVITVRDTKAPVLSGVPSDVTVECNAVPAPATVTANDNCSGSRPVSFGEVRTNGNCASNYTLTRTWTSVDACGNTATKTQVITVRDTQAPVLSAAPANTTVECDAVPAAATLTATDNCDAAPVVTFNEVRTAGNCPSNYTLTRTWTATDACGNTSSRTQTITVQDTKAPQLLNVPSNTTVECDAVPAAANVNATDNCDAAPVVTYSELRTNGSSLNNYTLTRTWTARDACGNTSSKTQVITVQDTKAPTVQTRNITVSLNASGTASITAQQIDNGSSDNCSGTVSLSVSPSVFDCSNVSAVPVPVTLKVTDAAGNFATAIAYVTVLDPISPVINCAANITHTADAGQCAYSFTPTAPSATDNCPGVIVTGVRDDGQALNAPYPTGSTTITWTATDAHGLAVSCTQKVIVTDNERPAIVCAAAQTVNLDANCSAVLPDYRSLLGISDNCTPANALAVTQSPAAGTALNGTGTITVNFTVTDAAGNSNSCSLFVTKKDVTPPVIVCTPSVTQPADPNTCGAVVTYTAPTATDNCTGGGGGKGNVLIAGASSLSWIQEVQSKLIATGKFTTVDIFNLGSGTPTVAQLKLYKSVFVFTDFGAVDPVTLGNNLATYINGGGGVVDAVFDNASVPIQGAFNTTAYRVLNPQSQTQGARRTLGTIVLPSHPIMQGVTSFDGGTSSYRSSSTSITSGSYVVAKYDNGELLVIAKENVSSGAARRASLNFYPPSTSSRSDFWVASTDGAKIMANALAWVGGASGVTITQTSGLPSGSVFPVGTTTNTFVAKDSSGNESSCSFTVTVEDKESPVLVGVPANTTVECDAVPAPANVTATDNCSTSAPVFTETRTNGSCASNYTLTRKWTTTDASNNTTTATQVITVRDTKAPVLSAVPAAAVVECDAVPAPATLTATDNCDAAPVVTFSEVRTAGNCPSNYTLTRTWTATDACGNTSSKMQVITVQDTKAPVLSAAPADATVECDAVPAPATLTATDNCDAAPVVTFSEVRTAGNCPSNYTLTRTWTATDACGNTSSRTQTITVQDTQAPVLSAAPADATVECDAVPAPATLTATDNCDAAPVVTFNEVRTNGNSESNYTLTRTWTATDACGNTSSKTQTITVQDITKPVITCPGNVTVNCQDDNTPAATGRATATDNCTDVPNIAISFSDASSYNADALSVQHYNYIITRTWRATDLSGNFSECVQTIKVQDVTKPVITAVPQNIERNNDATVCGAAVSFGAEASDNCGPVTITYSQAPGSVFPVGTTTVTITATDVTGNFSTASFTIKVNDVEKPIVKAPGAYSVPSDPGKCSAVINSIGMPVATDNCEIASVTNDHPSNEYPVGTTVVTWTVTDIHGNVTDTAKQLITVIDNELPTITVTTISRNTDLDKCGATIVLPQPVTADNCGVATVTNDHPSDFYPVGTTNVTWTVTDIHGLKTTTVQQVIVTDNQLPYVITRNITVNLSASGAVTISAADINNGSSDACGIASLSLDKTSFSCANVGQNTVTLFVRDVNGNLSSKTAVVTVVDNTAPVISAVVNQVFCANANGSTQYTIPTLSATDACSIPSISYVITGTTNRSGNGNNASGVFNPGASLITWTVRDVNGNTSTSKTTVQVNTLPVASITASSADAFCNKLTLTAGSTLNPASFRWTNSNGNFAYSQSINLDLTNVDGAYSVWVTDNNTGCTSAAAASYNYQKQNLANSYTILSFKDTKIGKYNKVNSGSVGVMGSRYEAEFDSYSSLSGTGAFVKAPYIDKHGFNINLNQQIIGVASVTLPGMQYNTVSTNGLPSVNAATNNATINGNYKNLTVKKGISVTVTGTIFGTVKLEEGASIRFTSPLLNIETLQADRGSKNNTYSYIRFAAGTSVRVSAKVSIGSQVWVNPENNQVTFYMGDLKSDEEKFTVNGADIKVTANVYMPNGKLKIHATDDDKDDYDGCSHKAHFALLCPHRGHDHNDCDHRGHSEEDCGDDVYMTGLFIAESVESHGNTVIWNSFSCGSAPAAITNNTNVVNASKGTTETEIVAATNEDLKVTVMPNPSTTHFTLKLSSRNTTPVNLRVMDGNGRTIDARSKLEPNSTFQIGQTYSSGTYYAEFTQGGTRKVVQLIKARG